MAQLLPRLKCLQLSNSIRTCVGCGAKAPQPALVRFARNEAQLVQVGRLLPGRGAWICLATIDDCLALARKSNGFARVLRGRIENLATDEDWVDLRQRIARSQSVSTEQPR